MKIEELWYPACGVMDSNLSPKGTPRLFMLLFSLATEGKTPSVRFADSSPGGGAYKEG